MLPISLKQCMSNKFFHYIKYHLSIIYGISLTLFLGKLISIFIPILSWPFNVMLGYLLGLCASILITVALLRLRVTTIQKIILGTSVLLVMAIISILLSLESLHTTKIHAEKMLN